MLGTKFDTQKRSFNSHTIKNIIGWSKMLIRMPFFVMYVEYLETIKLNISYYSHISHIHISWFKSLKKSMSY